LTIEKSQLRAAAILDVGARLDDELEKAERFLQQAIGAVGAFDEAAKSAKTLIVHVQTEIDKGEIDGETAKTVIRWLDRAANAATNLGVQARGKVVHFEGQKTGLKTAVETTSKMHTVEEAKGRMREDDVIPGLDQVIASGRRLPIKERRLAEEKPKPKKKAAKKKKG
jgi:hypothetical protein